MKIEYRAAGNGVGGWTVLADESVAALGARISGFQPKSVSQPAIEPGFGAGGVAVYDNGNDTWTVSFLIERQHASPDSAVTFLAAHPAMFSTLGNLDLKITQGGSITYMAAVARTEFTPDPASDQSTRCRYAFVGGSYSINAPA
ncbi:MAG TPA: hypothetical protein VNN22_24170 [Verrucomicrobiae bacterium]|nr:hypothetical protein [Verrucomicrobiae bacterium]